MASLASQVGVNSRRSRSMQLIPSESCDLPPHPPFFFLLAPSDRQEALE